MSSTSSKSGEPYQAGTERGDERRQTSAPVSQNRRSAPDRRDLQYGVKFKTAGSLITIEDWLDDNCADPWNLVLLDMDSDLDSKEIQIMFYSKADKEKFIAEYTSR